MHIKIEYIESLARGKKSGVGIGSRSVPHRLTQKEWRIFEEAKKDGYLSIPKTRRVNLENIYWHYTQMQGKEYLIIEEQNAKTSLVYREGDILYEGSHIEAKIFIQNLLHSAS